MGWAVLDRLPVEEDLAARRVLEAGDQPQQRDLAAARRDEQGQELTWREAQVAVDDGAGTLASDVLRTPCSPTAVRALRGEWQSPPMLSGPSGGSDPQPCKATSAASGTIMKV